jgi:hypothetical protein
LRHQGGRIAEEPPALTGVRIDAAIVDPRRNHLYRSGAGQDLTRLVSAVAYHQPAPVLVALGAEPGDVVIDLRLQRLGEHLAGTLADQLINQRYRTIRARVISATSSARNYRKHGSYLPDRRWRADLA